MSDERRGFEAFERTTRATPGEVARVRARLAAPERHVSPAWGAVLALPVVALFAMWMNPGDPETPAHLAIPLGNVAVVGPAPGVRLDVDGGGDVSGTERDLLVSWRSGTLGVEVEPNAGIALRVETPEGAARVVGTGFDVRRDALGTTVTVRHGLVDVSCAGEPDSRLAVGESRSCLPVTAPGLLGRARALQRAGVPADEVLATLDAALRRSPEPPFEDEIRVVRIDVLVRAGREADALADARAYLSDPDSSLRRPEIEALAAQLSAIVEGR